MAEKLCFVAVEFVDDPNVVGLTYWYLCDFDGAAAGDRVSAPLGRHNHIQDGVIRKVKYAYEDDAPYPVNFIKRIKSLLKEQDNV